LSPHFVGASTPASRLSYIRVCIYSRSWTSVTTATRQRLTQAERSSRTRRALLESAARGLSRYGYGNLVLEDVARHAGYTRGAIYHQFKDKEELALEVVRWTNETWQREVGDPAAAESDAVEALLTLARGHAIL